jgi:hypothetical protein
MVSGNRLRQHPHRGKGTRIRKVRKEEMVKRQLGDDLMKKEWLTLLNDVGKLPLHNEVFLFVKDLTPGPRKYDTHLVKAVLTPTPEANEQGGILRFRSTLGRPLPEIRGIRIIEETEPHVPGKPFSESISFIRTEK